MKIIGFLKKAPKAWSPIVERGENGRLGFKTDYYGYYGEDSPKLFDGKHPVMRMELYPSGYKRGQSKSLQLFTDRDSGVQYSMSTAQTSVMFDAIASGKVRLIGDHFIGDFYLRKQGSNVALAVVGDDVKYDPVPDDMMEEVRTNA